MRKTDKMRMAFVAAAIAAILALPGGVVRAATYYWDVNGTTAGFGTAGGTWAAPTVSRWSTSSAGTATPGASVTIATGDTVNFGYTTTGLGAGTITVSGTVNGGTGITFAAGSGAIVLSGGTINLGDATTGTTITVNNASDTISSVLTGSVLPATTPNLNKAGSGTLYLSGTNIYTGGTAITAGVLVLNSPGALGTLANGGVTLRGGILGLGAEDFTLGLGGASNYATAGKIYFYTNGGFAAYGADRSVNISGAGGFVGYGSGNVGTVVGTMNGKTLILGAADSTHKLIWVNGLDVGSATRTLQVNDGLAAVDAEISGVIRGAAGQGLNKTGTGTVVFSNLNTITGDLNVNAGTLVGAVSTPDNSATATAFGDATLSTRTIAVGSGATLRFDNANVLSHNFAQSVLPAISITGGTVTNNVAGNNALGNVTLADGALTATTGHATYGAFNLNGTITSTGASTISTSDPANGKMMLTSSGANNVETPSTFDVQSGTLTVSAPLAEVTAESKISGLSKIGAGTLVLSGANTYTGATAVSAGALAISGAGSANTSSGITVNGSTAKLVQNSSVAVSPTVTLTQGTLTGSGTVNTVNVGAGTGGVVSNNDGVAGAALTIGSLTFSGAATVNTFSNSISAAIVTTSLDSNSAGTVTINPSAAGWTSGLTYDLISYGGGSIGGAGFGQFALGAVSGLRARQETVFGNSGAAITLAVSSDTLYWKGDGDGKWNLPSTNNWKLVTAGTYTTFLNTDEVIFDDNATAAGPISVDIDEAGVAPFTTTFNNTKDYVLTSSGGFGISSGSLTKSGAGTVTISTVNTYAGPTAINAGAIVVSGSGTLGTGSALTLGGGRLDLGGTSQAVGALSVTAAAASGETISNGSLTGTSYAVNNETGTVVISANLLGTGAFTKSGAGEATLSGVNTYTGTTTVSAGVLNLTGNRTVNTATIFVGSEGTAAELNISNGNFGITSRMSVGVGASSAGNGTVNHTDGTLTFTEAGDQLLVGTGIGSGTYNLSGGSVITLAKTNRGVILGVNNGSSGTFNLSGTGELSVATRLQIGRSDYAGVNNTTNLFSQTGGTASVGTLSIGGNGTTGTGVNSTMTLTGGIFAATTFDRLAAGNTNTATITIGGTADVTLPAFPTTRGTGSSATVYFNGGTLRPYAASTAYMGGLTAAYIKAGGATFDVAGGKDITVTQSLLTDAVSTGGGLTKLGAGAMTVGGTNTYTGATTVGAGTLVLDYSANNTGKLSDTAALGLGGNLVLNGGSHTEIVASTSLIAGTVSSVTRASGSTAVLQMGDMTRGAGAVIDFGGEGIATTNTTNVNGILFGATINGADWATNSTNGPNGLITAYTGYTDVTRLDGGAQVIGDGSASNVRIVEGTGSPASITLGAATTTIFTLNQSAVGGASAATIDPAGQTLLTNAVLVGTGAGGLTIGTGTNNGTLAAAAPGGELALAAASANGLTINSVIADNSGSSLNVYSGTVTLAGANTYAGATTITGGALSIAAGNNIGDGSATNGLVLNGGTLRITGTALTEMSDLTNSGTRPITFTAGKTVGLDIADAGNTFTVDKVLDQATGGLTKLGAGTAVLDQANTYTGVTTVSTGTLQIGGGGAGGSLSTGSAITVASGAILAVNQSDTVTQGTDFSGAPISGAGGFAQAGSGTTILNAANTYTGGTTVSAGTLQAWITQTTNALGTGAVSVGTGSMLILDDQSVTNVANVPLISNVFTGNGLLKLQFAAGTTARNTYMPNVTGFGGTIQLSNLGTTGDKWNAANLGTIAGSLIVDSGNTIYVNSGTTSFTGGITLNGAGNSEGRGAIRISGATTVVGGDISLASSSTISMENVAAQLTGNISSGAAGTQTLTLGGTGSAGGILSGIIGGGAGTVNLATAVGGTYTLTNANTYTGGTTISGSGLITANNNSALGTGEVIFNGGTRLVVGSGVTIANAITIGANVGVAGRGLVEAGTTAGTATVSGPITINSGASAGGLFAAPTAGTILHVAGAITSSVQVTSRIGTVMFSGGGTGYADFSVQQGTVMVGADNGIATTATVTIGASGASVFDLNGLNQSLVGVTKGANAAVIGNSSTTKDSTLTITGASTFAGIIQDAVGSGTRKVNLTVNGGALTLTGANTYTGDTTVSAGTLSISTAYLADAADVFLTTGAVFDLAFTGTDTIDQLFVNGIGQLSGTWGAAGSGANHVSGFFTGTGLLNVTTSGVLPGDTNEDRVVDAADFITLKKNFGTSTGAGVAAGDFNTSDTVDWADLGILMNNFGAGGGAPATAPEPCSAMLLVLGAAAVIRRRARIGRVGQ